MTTLMTAPSCHNFKNNSELTATLQPQFHSEIRNRYFENFVNKVAAGWDGGYCGAAAAVPRPQGAAHGEPARFPREFGNASCN